MRLATFNVMHGRSPSDGLVDLPRLREALAAIDADVLGLQEVDRGQPRSNGHDLSAEAAAAMGGEGRFAPAMMGTPGERWRPVGDGPVASDEPAYGIALISRLPVRRWAMARLPFIRVRAPVLVAGPARRVVWLPDEPRVLLAAVLDTPGGLLTVATTHLSFVPGWNGMQLRRAVRALRSLPAPQVLLGDLNLPGPLPRSLTGWRRLGKLPTYPAEKPRVQLDHVLADSRRPPQVMAAHAPAVPISDHRPLVVDLTEVGGRIS